MVALKSTTLPTWGDEEGPSNQSDWSRPEEEDLECLPPLDPHVQEFLLGEEMPSASVGMGDSPQ